MVAPEDGSLVYVGWTLTRLQKVPSPYIELEQSMSAGYIVLSVCFAILGSLCTLELLLQRTSNRGKYNVALLVAAGICFGSVSTFSMHFIGNNSLVLRVPTTGDKSYPPLTLAYAAGWTVLSLCVSCLCMTGAFFVMGLEVGWSKWFTVGRKSRHRSSSSDHECRERHQDHTREPVPTFNFSEHKTSIEMEDTEESSNGQWAESSSPSLQTQSQSTGYRFPPLPPSHLPTPSPPSSISAPTIKEAQAIPLNTARLSRQRWSVPANAHSALTPRMHRATARLPELTRVQSLPKHSSPLKTPLSPPAEIFEQDIKPNDPSAASTPSTHSDPSTPEPLTVWQRSMKSPLMIKLAAFLGLDVVTKAEVFKILIAGTICGWGIAGMHYLGQKSIVSIPYIGYTVGNVVGSVIIACAAVMIGLYIMFIILRPKLKHGWPTKLGVACVLGGAVCAMHYIAMGGTTYALIRGVMPPQSAFGGTKKMITGIVSALAILACLCIFTFIVITHMQQVAHRRGRRRVVVATMIYDQHDRLLVAPDGVVPMCDIASVDVSTQAQQRSRRFSVQNMWSQGAWDNRSTTSSVLDIDLSVSHPAFIAALRSTWAWRRPGTVPSRRGSLATGNNESLLPTTHPPSTRPTGHMGQTLWDSISGTPRHYKDEHRASIVSMAESAVYPASLEDQLPMTQSVGKFLDRFINAACHLAGVVTGNESDVKRLGVLYDRILSTGHGSIKDRDGIGETSFSKGQLMFLVRRVTSSHEHSVLKAHNYLFAEPHAVAAKMSRTLAVPKENFLEIIDEQRDFCDQGMESELRPGMVYAMVCVVHPTPFEGMQVCVDPAKRHQLPLESLGPLSTRVGTSRTSLGGPSQQSLGTIEEIGLALSKMKGLTLFDMLAPVKQLYPLADMVVDSDAFGEKLQELIVNALIPLLDDIMPSQSMAKVLPQLRVVPQLVPLSSPIAIPTTSSRRPSEVSHSLSMAWGIVFKAVVPVEDDEKGIDWEPWSLFRAQQECVQRDARESSPGSTSSIHKHGSLSYAAPPSLPPQTPTAAGQHVPRRPSKVQWSAPLPPSMLSGSSPSTPVNEPVHASPPGEAYNSNNSSSVGRMGLVHSPLFQHLSNRHHEADRRRKSLGSIPMPLPIYDHLSQGATCSPNSSVPGTRRGSLAPFLPRHLESRSPGGDDDRRHHHLDQAEDEIAPAPLRPVVTPLDTSSVSMSEKTVVLGAATATATATATTTSDEAAPGVGLWNQDWLTQMLKQDLAGNLRHR